MNKTMKRRTLWISLIAGLIGGVLLKPIVFPWGFSEMHGLGVIVDIALAGMGVGVAFIAYALLTRHSRNASSLSSPSMKWRVHFNINA
jgi:hypothetical protein